jgi:hypothetical protein
VEGGWGGSFFGLFFGKDGGMILFTVVVISSFRGDSGLLLSGPFLCSTFGVSFAGCLSFASSDSEVTCSDFGASFFAESKNLDLPDLLDFEVSVFTGSKLAGSDFVCSALRISIKAFAGLGFRGGTFGEGFFV